MKREFLKMGAVGALTLLLPACGTPAETDLNDDVAMAPGLDAPVSEGRIQAQPEISREGLVVNAQAMQDYEALVSAKPAAAPGARFQVEPHQANVLHEEVEPSSAFSLALSLPKADYVLGEPVTVRATLTNVSDEPLQVAPLLDPVFDRFEVTVTGADGVPRLFKPTVFACTLPTLALRTLEPGETYTHDFNVFAAKGGWFLPEAGDYAVQATLLGMSDAARRVVAQPVDFTILPGTAEEQAVAARITKGEAALLLDYGDGDQFEAGRAVLEDVVSSHPDTVHALYAGYTLGNMWGNDFYRVTGTRPADARKAVSYLAPVHARLTGEDAPVVSPTVVSGVAQLLAESYLALGQADQARATLEGFVAAHGDDPMLEGAVIEARDLLEGL